MVVEVAAVAYAESEVEDEVVAVDVTEADVVAESDIEDDIVAEADAV